MKSNILMSLLVACIATPAALASETLSVNDSVLRQIEQVENGRENIRFRLSRKLIVERVSSTSSNTEIQRGIIVSSERHLLEEIIPTESTGKVVAIEGANVSTILRQGATCPSDTGVKTIYVTFDRDCNSKECAFGFSKMVIQRPSTETVSVPMYQGMMGTTTRDTCVNTFVAYNADDNLYYLSKIPSNDNYVVQQAYSSRRIVRVPLHIEGSSTANVYMPETLTARQISSRTILLESQGAFAGIAMNRMIHLTVEKIDLSSESRQTVIHEGVD